MLCVCVCVCSERECESWRGSFECWIEVESVWCLVVDVGGLEER